MVSFSVECLECEKLFCDCYNNNIFFFGGDFVQKTEVINFRVSSELKQKLKSMADEKGLSVGSFLTMFLIELSKRNEND